MLCVLYVTAAGFCLGIATLFIERSLPPTAQRRWLWVAIIPISVFLPGFYRGHNNWSLSAMDHSGAASTSHLHPATSIAALDPGIWARIERLDPLIGRLWGIASGVLLILAVTNAMRVSHVLSISRSAKRMSGDDPLLDGVDVLITDCAGPATVGVWRPRVLVPRWVLGLPPVEQRYVLRHEEEHRRAHDARLLFFASLPLILAPWNAALWWQLRRLCLAVEMDCDNRVVSALGDANRYGELLLKVAEASSRGMQLQPAFIGGMGTLERRLTGLLAPTPLRYVQRFLFPAFALSLLLLVLRVPHPILKPDPPSRTAASVEAHPIHQPPR